jgi:hypothetical protein
MEAVNRYRIVIAAVVLLGLAGLTWWAISTRSGETAPSAEDAPELPEIDRDAITAIEIRRPRHEEDPAETIRLVKEGESWALTEPVEAPASTTTIDTVLDRLDDLEVTGIAARNRTSHEELEVARDNGLHVIVSAGRREVIDFWIGAFRGGNTMIRLDGEDRVLMVRGSIKFAFNKPSREWRDRAIVDIEPGTVHETTFTNANGTFHFRKNGENWEQVLEPAAEGEEPPAGIERFDAAKVRTAVTSLARLRASDFAAANVNASRAGLGANAARVTFVAGEGEERTSTTLIVGNEVEEGSRYVMREGDETIYVVSRFMADRLIPTTASFQAAEPGSEPPPEEEPPMDPHGGGMPGMPGGGQLPPEIMQQIQRQLQQQQQQQGGGETN